MSNSVRTEKKSKIQLGNPGFWNIGLMFYFYFVIWALTFAFLPVWLEREAGFDPDSRGLLFSTMALIAFILQPFLGILQDKLGYRKHLFGIVVVAGILIGPFFRFVFLPLSEVMDDRALAVLGGLFLSLSLNSGVGIVEAFNERNARAKEIEYGHVRLFGSLAGASASFAGGFIWANNPDNIWVTCSFSAVLLGVLLYVLRTPQNTEVDDAEAKANEDDKVTLSKIKKLFSSRSFWGFMVLTFGAAAMFDVFDQQFPNYFGMHVDSVADPQVLFSRVVAVQILLEALFMLFAPWLVNKISAKNGLIIFGLILVVRIWGSALVTTTGALITWRLLAAIEMPFMLISIMKYVTRMFDSKITATAYLIGFNMAKQVGLIIFSSLFGWMYAGIGFETSYLVMGALVLVLVLIAAFVMRSDKGVEAPTIN